MDLIRRNPLLAVLAVAAVLLAVAIALELALGDPAAPPASGRRAAAPEAKLLPPLAAVAPEQAYPETAGRPLFTPTRRPAPEAVVVQQPTFQKGQFVLLGVTIAGDTRIAMLREKSTGRLFRVERGRDVNGIKVQGVEPDGVVLAMGAEQEHVPLLVQRPGAPGAPAAAGHPPTASIVPTAPAGGPFAAAAPAGAHPPAAPGAANAPFPRQSNVPGMPPVAATTAGVVAPPPAANAAAQPNAPPAAEPALSPEELLARRRARRAQQTQ